MGYLMGIDIGTSSVKAIIIDADGSVVALAKKNHNLLSPHAGWVDENPEDWWQGCCGAAREALETFPGSADDIDCIGISAQMHSLVPLDKNRNLIRPAILHNDSRAGKQAAALAVELGIEKIRQEILNPITPGLTLASLLWMREIEPENFEKIRYVFLPGTYIRYRLTGEIGIDHSDASATLAYDFKKCNWSTWLLDLVGIPLEYFPPISDSAAIAGRISKEAAEETGLAQGTPVVFGGADQVMQAIGSGCLQPGQATANIGSGGQICIQVSEATPNPEAGLNYFLGRDTQHRYLMGATGNSGSSLKWLCQEIFHHLYYAAIDAAAAQVTPGSNGLLFLPYLSGERCPLLNPNIGGAFWGLTHKTDRARMARSVMEGVAFSLKASLDLCTASSGFSPESLVALGGGASSNLWLQIQSDVYGKALVLTQSKEQAVLGAAITAGVGIGTYRTFREGCDTCVSYGRVIEPDMRNHALYQEYFAVFTDIYTLASSALERAAYLGRQTPGKLQ